MGQSFSRLAQNRNAKTLGELAPRTTPGNQKPIPELDRDTLIKALQDVAAYIAKKGHNITIVAVDGAVNTILLQSRRTTHDIDFFNEHLSKKDFELLVNGAKKAVRENRALQEEWFNNRPVLFIPSSQRQTLTDEALRQREIIFELTGLRVVAAPWNYAFCCKVDRLAGGGHRSYDLSDACHYSQRFLMRNNATQIRKQIEEWFTLFELRWTSNDDSILSQINSTYRSMFGISSDIIVV